MAPGANILLVEATVPETRGVQGFPQIVAAENYIIDLYGDVIDAIIAFVTVAGVIYFVIVVPMNRLTALRARGVVDVSTRECPECLSAIPKAARRCSFCTVEVGPTMSQGS
jgi:large-conductance mechanosensitive channel